MLQISSLVDKALQPFKLKKKEPVADGIIKFFEQRADALFQANGYPYDAVSSVLHFIKDQPLFTVKERLDSLMKFRAEGACDSFLLALKRINNIAPGGDVPAADKALFVQEEEKLLFQETESRAAKVNSLVKRHLYYDAIKVLQELTEPINRFFDKVLIMDKNEETKQNRLSLLKTIRQLAVQVADFSRLS